MSLRSCGRGQGPLAVAINLIAGTLGGFIQLVRSVIGWLGDMPGPTRGGTPGVGELLGRNLKARSGQSERPAGGREAAATVHPRAVKARRLGWLVRGRRSCYGARRGPEYIVL